MKSLKKYVLLMMLILLQSSTIFIKAGSTDLDVDGDSTITSDTSVYATNSSGVQVKVPSALLTREKGIKDFDIGVKGNIASNQYVTTSVSSKVTLTDESGNGKKVGIVSGRDTWYSDSISSDKFNTSTFSFDTSGLSSGSWTGELVIDIKLNKLQYTEGELGWLNFFTNNNGVFERKPEYSVKDLNDYRALGNKRIVVPHYFEGKEVKKVGDSTFVTTDPYSYHYEVGDDENVHLLDIDEIYIEDGVAEIGNKSFMGLKANTVRLPNTLVSIGNFAFHDTIFKVASKYAIHLPNSCKSLGVGAFGYAKGVVYLGAVESLGDACFSNFNNGSSSIYSLTIPESVTSIGSMCFSESYLGDIDIYANVSKIPKQCFARARVADRIYIGDNIIELGEGAFYQLGGFSGYTSKLEGAKNVTILGTATFRESTITGDLYFPSVNFVGETCFQGSTLGNVTFERPDVYINYRAFYNLNQPITLKLNFPYGESISHYAGNRSQALGAGNNVIFKDISMVIPN